LDLKKEFQKRIEIEIIQVDDEDKNTNNDIRVKFTSNLLQK
jgi:hypothetical protein